MDVSVGFDAGDNDDDDSEDAWPSVIVLVVHESTDGSLLTVGGASEDTSMLKC